MSEKVTATLALYEELGKVYLVLRFENGNIVKISLVAAEVLALATNGVPNVLTKSDRK